MVILRKILRMVCPSLFDYVEVETLRFVPEVKPKRLVHVLKSDEVKFFLDHCERKARIALGQEQYKGVRFVMDELESIERKFEPKRTPIKPTNMLRLDDEGLLEEEAERRQENAKRAGQIQ